MSRSHCCPDFLEGIEEDLARDIKQYEEWFTLESPMLKKITDYFVNELNQGLAEKGGKLVSNST